MKNINELKYRERQVLSKIIQLYILKGEPIGSRTLAKNLEHELGLSASTLRNLMSDLEELEYISHPHTSAGRVPTDKGYRFYVDNLNEIDDFNQNELNRFSSELAAQDYDSLFKSTTRLLSWLSNSLAIVQLPEIKDCVVTKIELLPISVKRLLIVISLDSNFVRTVTLESSFLLDRYLLEEINAALNEKLSGKPLRFIRENFISLIQETDFADKPIIRLFTNSLDKIVERLNPEERVLHSGATNLLNYPEFEDLSKVRTIIELLENQDVIIHLLEKADEQSRVKVLIGQEIDNNLLNDYGMVLTTYHYGSALGSMGIIGPKRMDYPKMISFASTFANILSKL